MADGFFRVARCPLATLFHCGLGLGNGIANLHNARRAGSGYGKVASLVLPADVSRQDVGVEAQPTPPSPADPSVIGKVAAALRSGRKTVMIPGTQAVTLAAQPIRNGLTHATGVDLMASPMVAAIPRGCGRLKLRPVPDAVDDAVEVLLPYHIIVLVNCPPPVGASGWFRRLYFAGAVEQAREKLNCTTLLLNNRSYVILMGEYAKVRANPGETAQNMMGPDRPALDWVKLAEGFGVADRAVATIEEFEEALECGVSIGTPT